MTISNRHVYFGTYQYKFLKFNNDYILEYSLKKQDNTVTKKHTMKKKRI